MLTSNKIVKFPNKSISDGNKEGVPYGKSKKLTRMTTALGLNDKFLTYLSYNRTVVYWKEIEIFACYEKKRKEKEKESFNEFNWLETFSSCTVFSMSKSLNFLSLSF